MSERVFISGIAGSVSSSMASPFCVLVNRPSYMDLLEQLPLDHPARVQHALDRWLAANWRRWQ